ncbi:unnamed protein product [Rotaria sordida]|uniref:Uncharacterized protein n=1 Tax=Rotaria sordida TaxID=392033 RepID=A0A813SFN1_9BILA|nr:unnamed protein product [Rotaria sordida]CAF0896959.1 unnamed protein product [Rotaria sordida]CAF3543316.1 unnamed protein product [Rotaria sordida]
MENIKQAGQAAVEKVKEVSSGASYEANKEAAKNDNLSASSRISHGVNAVGDKIDEKSHEAKKEGHKEIAEEKGVIGQIGDTISNAYHYVAEKVSEVTSGASYEANKEKVKDSDNTVGERVGAGFSAVGDKIEEKAHKAKAEAHKESL